LPAKRLDLVAGQSPGAARAAVTALDRSGNPFGVLHRVRAAAVLDDRELLAIARPARHVLQYAHAAPDGFVDLLTESLTAAHRPAGFWPAMRRLLPEFDGTVPALLAAASA
jgi:curli biogenesis system outer membrane secretion channel CsgG